MKFYKIDGRSDFGKKYINSFRYDVVLTSIVLNDFCYYTGIERKEAKTLLDTVLITKTAYDNLEEHEQSYFDRVQSMYFLKMDNPWGDYFEVISRVLVEAKEPSLLDYIDDWNGDNLALSIVDRKHIAESEIVTDCADVYIKSESNIHVDNNDIQECEIGDFLTARVKQRDIILAFVGELDERLQ